MYTYIYPLSLFTHSMIHKLTQRITHTYVTLKPPQPHHRSQIKEEEEEDEDFVDSSKLTLDPVDPRLTTSHVVKTGEENEEILFEARSRVSRFVPKDVYGDEERTNRWVSRGKGQLKILRDKTTNKCRLLHRQEKTYKVRLNIPLLGTESDPSVQTAKARMFAGLDFSEDEKKIQENINLYKRIKKIQTSGVHRDLIFIVGMPRSGSSLVEQILASHKKVFGGGELPYIQEIAQKIICEEKIDATLIDNFRNGYLDLIAELNNSSSVFTDKELLNFNSIGLILSLFPNAKIINCTRDPLDNCWSIYKNFFPIKTKFVNNFKDIVKFYKLYLNTMDFWQKEFPKNIYNLKYESLVEDPKKLIGKILAFCNLEWDENVMSHHKNSRIIRTLSFDQANKPISKKVSNTIKNYKDIVGDLIKELKI